ncbi:MAG: proprotein convertase P-domain-containing protein [Bacteroidota bacterium]
MGGGTITFTDANIPGLLSVSASDPGGGNVTYSTDVASVDCTDEGNMVAITVTATNDDAPNETATCLINATIQSAGGDPSAVCQAITVMLDASGMATVLPAEIDGGSFSCSGITTMTIDGNPSLNIDCAGAVLPSPQMATLEVTDGFGSATCMAAITIEDNIDPTFTCPAGQTVVLNADCDIVIPDLVTAIVDEMDACGVSDAKQTPTAGSVENSSDGGTINVTIEVSDAYGNIASCIVVLTGDDTTPPMANCQAYTAYLDNAGSVTLAATDINDGSSDNCGTASLSIPATTFTCADIATNPNMVMLTVNDGNGNTNTCMAAVTVADTIAPGTYPDLPTSGVINNSTGDCQATVVWPNNVPDNCDGTVVTTINSAIDFKGNPIPVLTSGSNYFGNFPVGTSEVRYTAMDAAGNSVTDTFDIVVTDNELPLVNCPASPVTQFITTCNLAAEAVPSFLGQATISDNCSPNLTVVQDPAPGTLLSSLGLTPADGEMYAVTIFVDDDFDNIPNRASCSFTVNLVEDDAPAPDVTGATLPTAMSECGPITIDAPTATDACGNTICGSPFPATSVIPLGGTCSGGNASNSGTNNMAAPIPDGVAFAEDSPGAPLNSIINISGIPATNTLADIIVTVDITHSFDGDLEIFLVAPDGTTTLELSTDNGGAGDNYQGTVFQDGNPSITTGFAPFAGDFGPEGGSLVTTFTGVPSLNGDWTLRIFDDFIFDQGALNSWSIEIITNPPPGSLPQYQLPVGNYTLTWIYDDGNGNTSQQLQQVDIANDSQAPSLTCQEVTLELDMNGMASIATEDLLAVDGISITSSDISPCFNPIASNNTMFSITMPNSMVISFDWDFITVDDPDFDQFGVMINGTFTELTNPSGPNAQSSTYLMGLNAGDVFAFVARTDDQTCGSGTTVISNFSPGFTGDLSIENWTFNANGGDGTFSTITGEATDNCTATANIGLVASQNNFTCADLGTNSITVTATDEQNNMGTCTATVTIVDNMAPFNFVGVPSSTSAQCGNVPTNTANVSASDNCDTPIVQFSESSTQTGNPDNCGNYSYTITRTWTASDNSNNTSTATQVITVVDSQAPSAPVYSATGPEGTFTNGATINTNANDCFASVNLSLLGLDDCAPFANIDIVNNVNANGSVVNTDFAVGPHTVTFTTTDPCGNVSMHNFTFTVVDGLPPVASCVNSLNLGLPASGTLILSPQAVNNNSFDNCTAQNDLVLSVTPDTFTCAQVGMTVPVVLTITDEEGLSSSCSTTVTIQDNNPPTPLCQSITVSIDSSSTVSITAADVDNGSFDDCALHPTNALSVSPSTFTTADIGSNTVTLTVRDAQNNTNTCTTTVTVTPPPTCFSIGAEVGGAGDIVNVPITVSDFTSITSFQFTLELDDQPVGEFVGVSGINPALSNLFLDQLIVTDSMITSIDTMFVPDIMGNDSIGSIDTMYMDLFDNISVSWQQLAGGPVTLADGEIAFFVDVLLTGNLQDFSFISPNPNLSNTPPEVVFDFSSTLIQTTPCFFNGGVQISELIVSGNIFNEYGEGINLVDVDLFEVPVFIVPEDTDVTGMDGAYEFIINVNGDYRVVPSKNINWSNGIDILDVAGIQRHAVGNQFVPTAYKKIAADVSDDGLITTFDAVLLNQFLSSGFTSAPPPNDSWRFSDAKEMLPYEQNAIVPSFTEMINFVMLNSDTAQNDFVAVKIGDIAGLMADTAQLNSGDTRGVLQFVMEDRPLKAGELYHIDVRANDFANLIGYQWVLNFDATTLAYRDMNHAHLSNLSDANVGLNFVDEGKIILTWYDAFAVSAADDEVLFTLTFEAKQDAPHLSRLLSRTTLDQLPAVAYTETETPFDIDLVFTEFSGVISDPVFALFQNQPNPFKGETLISFTLPEATEGSLTIMDLAGRVVRTYKGQYDQGYNEVVIDRSDLSASGVLYYQLSTPEHTATRKMIIIE